MGRRGFEVINLGINVDADKFINAIREHNARSAGHVGAAHHHHALHGDRDRAAARQKACATRSKCWSAARRLNAAFAEDIGADAYCKDAAEAVAAARAMMALQQVTRRRMNPMDKLIDFLTPQPCCSRRRRHGNDAAAGRPDHRRLAGRVECQPSRGAARHLPGLRGCRLAGDHHQLLRRQPFPPGLAQLPGPGRRVQPRRGRGWRARWPMRAGSRGLVAGSMGPTGEILDPLGLRTAEEVARRPIAEQAAALAEGGVDFFLVETMSALEEVQAAVEGIRSASDLPVAVTMTFDTRLHTMMGVSPSRPWRRCTAWACACSAPTAATARPRPGTVIGQMARRQAGRRLPDRPVERRPAEVGKKQITYDGTPEVMAAYAAADAEPWASTTSAPAAAARRSTSPPCAAPWQK